MCDPASLRDENVLMLGILTCRMLERSDEARDLREERGILSARVSLRYLEVLHGSFGAGIINKGYRMSRHASKDQNEC